MLKNVGNIDRVVRLLAAAVFAWLFYNGTVVGVLGYGLMVLSIVFVVTAVVGYCPIYQMLGCSTCPVDSSKGRT